MGSWPYPNINYLIGLPLMLGPDHYFRVVPSGQCHWSTARGGQGKFVLFLGTVAGSPLQRWRCGCTTFPFPFPGFGSYHYFYPSFCTCPFLLSFPLFLEFVHSFSVAKCVLCVLRSSLGKSDHGVGCAPMSMRISCSIDSRIQNTDWQSVWGLPGAPAGATP